MRASRRGGWSRRGANQEGEYEMAKKRSIKSAAKKVVAGVKKRSAKRKARRKARRKKIKKVLGLE
jgi:hypothetical protein